MMKAKVVITQMIKHPVMKAVIAEMTLHRLQRKVRLLLVGKEEKKGRKASVWVFWKDGNPKRDPGSVIPVW